MEKAKAEHKSITKEVEIMYDCSFLNSRTWKLTGASVDEVVNRKEIYSLENLNEVSDRVAKAPSIERQASFEY